MEYTQIKKIINDALSENETLFLIDFDISEKHIKVVLDGEKGVPIKECVRINRCIEEFLEDDTEHSIEVASFEVGHPLKNLRQYKKNIERKLEIKKTDGNKTQGKLIEVNEKNITITRKERQKKQIGKGKQTVIVSETISHQNIKEAIVKIIF